LASYLLEPTWSRQDRAPWETDAVVHQEGIGAASHGFFEEALAGADAGGEELDFLPASHLEAVGHVGVLVPHVAHEVFQKGHQIA